MSDTHINESIGNPLLRIDTSFRSYLNAYTRSFKNHVVGGGALDYAFDADFAVRQKINGLSSWAKLSKSIVAGDITEEAKYLFLKINQAGPLNFPEVYDIVKKCSARLELNQPIVFVRTDTEKALIYSIASDIIDPCIVLSTALINKYTDEELQLMIGCECGRIQNNHCSYNIACTYLSFAKNGFKPTVRSFDSPISNQVICALVEWIKYSEITADRAGMICFDNPSRYVETLAGMLKKGYADLFGRIDKNIDYAKVAQLSEDIHLVAARQLAVSSSLTKSERRLLCALEFLSCETLYNWRPDAVAEDIHVVNSQVCDVRSNIILGTVSEI